MIKAAGGASRARQSMILAVLLSVLISVLGINIDTSPASASESNTNVSLDGTFTFPELDGVDTSLAKLEPTLISSIEGSVVLATPGSTPLVYGGFGTWLSGLWDGTKAAVSTVAKCLPQTAIWVLGEDACLRVIGGALLSATLGEFATEAMNKVFQSINNMGLWMFQ